MARTLYLDCFSGASGDMVLGALLDAGLPFDGLRDVVSTLQLDDVTIAVDRVDRCGIAATKFRVVEGSDGAPLDPVPGSVHRHDHELDHHHGVDAHDHQHDDQDGAHDHQHGEHAHDHPGHGRHHHRGLSDIAAIVERSGLSAAARTRAIGLFTRLAEVEAGIHQMPIEQVHLHEVGAVDSIVDIVGAVFAFEWFAPDRIVASPLNVGSGTVHCAHGELPVPAPATTRLLEGAPIYAHGPRGELLTPTGALLVTDYASEYGAVPSMTLGPVGYGAGDRNPKGMPNVLRVLVGETGGPAPLERVVVVECQIDDMNPQIYGVLMDRLHAAGALDVFYAPIQMKKNRPGTLVTVIASPDRRQALCDLLFAETTTIGVRVSETSRERLERDLVAVDTPLGVIRMKVARRDDTVLNAAPEFDDCVRVAEANRVSVKHVQAVAAKAWLERNPETR